MLAAGGYPISAATQRVGDKETKKNSYYVLWGEDVTRTGTSMTKRKWGKSL